MKSQRQLQLGENIKRLMTEVFVRGDVLTIPGSHITILEADVSPDAKNAKIYIDIFGNDKMHDQIVKALNKAVPHFRHHLSKNVALRVVPQIKFILDKTQEQAFKIEGLIAKESGSFESKEDSEEK
jgi:ribosome-binding factor A